MIWINVSSILGIYFLQNNERTVEGLIYDILNNSLDV